MSRKRATLREVAALGERIEFLEDGLEAMTRAAKEGQARETGLLKKLEEAHAELARERVGREEDGKVLANTERLLTKTSSELAAKAAQLEAKEKSLERATVERDEARGLVERVAASIVKTLREGALSNGLKLALVAGIGVALLGGLYVLSKRTVARAASAGAPALLGGAFPT